MDAELLNLRAALNEKDLELIELREQHVHLVVGSLLDAKGRVRWVAR